MPPAADALTTLPTHLVVIGVGRVDPKGLASLLRQLPATSAAAYVLVTQDSSDRAEWTRLATAGAGALPVIEVVDQRPLRAGALHVAGKDGWLRIDPVGVSVREGRQRPEDLPVDAALMAAAEIFRERSIAVLAIDTTDRAFRGAREIKEAGGLIIIQDAPPEERRGQRALAIGLADCILPLDDIPRELETYLARDAREARPGDDAVQPGDDLRRILATVADRTGVDFSDYKTSTVLRRVERRMQVNHAESLPAYLELIAHSAAEAAILYRELLIGVTRFFRDPQAFELLRDKVIMPLLEREGRKGSVRAWVAGCATGEEAYTIAILFQEALLALDSRATVKIFATDLDRDAIHFAGAGIYPESIAADVPKELLERWFTRKGDSYLISKQIREMVVFAPHNITKDPPFYKIDLITCRNLLIYLQPQLQRRLFTAFHFALNSGGHLMLGTSETLGELAQFFTAVDSKHRIYEKQAGKKSPPFTDGLPVSRSPHSTVPSLTLATSKKEPTQLGEELEQAINQLLLREFIPGFLVVGENFEIAHVFGDIGRYLRLPVGKPTFNILKMAPRELGVALGTGIRRALKESKQIVYDDIELPDARGDARKVRLVVKPVGGARSPSSFVVVIFEESGDQPPREPGQHFDIGTQAEQRIQDLELEVEQTTESLQAAIEELETANEELQATNEEVLAANEELQSTNEELQSVNEELYTVNAEHQAKITELTELNNDILNFLASTNIGTVFLDQRLCVRKFTPAATMQINLMDRDIGRPLAHISTNLRYADLVADAAEVLKTLVPKQQEVTTKDGRWYLMRVLPYRTEDNVIKGVVLTFIDVSEVKTAHASLRKLTTVVESSASITMITDANGAIEYVNRRFVEATGWTPDEVIGKNARILRSERMDGETIRRMWAEISAGRRWQGRFVNRAKSGAEYAEDAVIMPMLDADGRVVNYFKIAEISAL